MAQTQTVEDPNVPDTARKKVVERDNGQCQVTGDKPIQVHHVKYRSQGGEDDPANLICVSPEIHKRLHEGNLKIIQFDPGRDEFTVARTDTGELVEPLWWYDKPERDADEAHEVYQQIKSIREDETKNRLFLGKALTRFEDGRLYESLGHNTFESFIGDPEVDIGRSTAYRYMKVYRRFLLMAETPAEDVVKMGMRKAGMISRFVNDPAEDIQEWIEKAKMLSRSDLQEEINEATGENEQTEDTEDGENPGVSEPGYVTRIRNYTQDLREAATVDDELSVLRSIREIVEDQIEQLSERSE